MSNKKVDLKKVKAGVTLWVVFTTKKYSDVDPNVSLTHLYVLPVIAKGRVTYIADEPMVPIFEPKAHFHTVVYSTPFVVGAPNKRKIKCERGSVFTTYRQAVRAAVLRVEATGQDLTQLVHPKLSGKDLSRIMLRKSKREIMEGFIDLIKNQPNMLYIPPKKEVYNDFNTFEPRPYQKELIDSLILMPRRAGKMEALRDLGTRAVEAGWIPVVTGKVRKPDPSQTYVFDKLLLNSELKAHVSNTTPLYDPDRIRTLQESGKEAVREMTGFKPLMIAVTPNGPRMISEGHIDDKKTLFESKIHPIPFDHEIIDEPIFETNVGPQNQDPPKENR